MKRLRVSPWAELALFCAVVFVVATVWGLWAGLVVGGMTLLAGLFGFFFRIDIEIDRGEGR